MNIMKYKYEINCSIQDTDTSKFTDKYSEKHFD